MKRLIYRVQWNRQIGMWRVYIGRDHYHSTLLQREAIEEAVGAARVQWNTGRPTQVVLHGKNGRIRWERTYGRDPRRSKG
jgi:hypothetical protein